MQQMSELISFMLDMDAPHRLGEIPDEEGKKTKWLKSGDGVYSTCQDSEVVETMDAGTYYVFRDSRGSLHAQKFNVGTDELYMLPNNHVTEVTQEIANFWTRADKFKSYNIKHKRGVLFEGPPGTGKTSAISMLASSLIQNNGLVFYCHNVDELFMIIDFLNDHLRAVEPNRPIILILEDIDKYMDGQGVESTLLNFLDGDESIDHIVVVATTNRFDELNDLILRPSRFDYHVEVGKPDSKVREAYLLKKGLDAETAKAWAKDTENFSIAELKELFTSVILLELDYEKAKVKINEQASNVVNKTSSKPKAKKAKLGF